MKYGENKKKYQNPFVEKVNGTEGRVNYVNKNDTKNIITLKFRVVSYGLYCHPLSVVIGKWK